MEYTYRIKNRTKREVKLEIIPHLQFAAKGQLLEKEQKFTLEGNEIHSGGMTVYFYTNGEAVSFEGESVKGFFMLTTPATADAATEILISTISL